MIVQAPALDVSTRAGSGQLAVEVVAGQSAATVAEARSPLKVLVPRPRGQSVWAYLSNFGGGLLPGDEIDFSISVGDASRCFLGTQSSTKIFRGGAKGVVRNLFDAEIGSGGLLVYAPDVAQSFATSRYVQTQSIRLADESANLVFVDWYSSGRAARDERWSFSEYSSRNEIRVHHRLVFLDAIRLNSADDLITLGERFGRINCVATVVILGVEVEKYAIEGAKEVASSPISKRAEILETASAIPGGAVFRIAGASVEVVARRLLARINFVSSLLGDNPFQRKW
jgi:urease accessory protein